MVLKLGYKASAEQFGPRALIDFSVLAESLGFDSVMVSDHFQPWRHTDGHAPYSFSLLAALGERTSRIVMGTSVVTPTFRYHPSIVAQAMGTLGALNPGRVLLEGRIDIVVPKVGRLHDVHVRIDDLESLFHDNPQQLNLAELIPNT